MQHPFVRIEELLLSLLANGQDFSTGHARVCTVEAEPILLLARWGGTSFLRTCISCIQSNPQTEPASPADSTCVTCNSTYDWGWPLKDRFPGNRCRSHAPLCRVQKLSLGRPVCALAPARCERLAYACAYVWHCMRWGRTRSTRARGAPLAARRYTWSAHTVTHTYVDM